MEQGDPEQIRALIDGFGRTEPQVAQKSIST
jgi:hypothetical protein